MALTTIVNLGLVASLTKQVATEEYASHPLKEGWEFNWATGTGEDQANSVFHVAGTAAAGVPVVLDLLGGGLTDAFGDAIAFTSLKAIFIRNTSTTDVNLLAEGTVGFFVTTGQVLLPGGAGLSVACGRGWTVTAGSGDTLTLTAPDEDCTYEVILIGTR